jgi:hypothetical protein
VRARPVVERELPRFTLDLDSANSVVPPAAASIRYLFLSFTLVT